MRSIYILLTRPETNVSRIIHVVTADKYTHASMSFEPDLRPLYSFARKYVNQPLPAGLRIEPLTEGFFKKYNYINCGLYEVQVSDEVYEKARQEVERMMPEAKRYRFSVIGLFLCKLNIPLHRERRRFCSEFVADILSHSGAVTLPKVPSLMRPSELAELPELTCKFEGKFYEMLAYLEEQKAGTDNEERAMHNEKEQTALPVG